MMSETIELDGQRFLTLGQLSEHLKTPIHRVKYVLERHRIAPAARVGIIRVWSENDLPRIRQALAHVRRSRGSGGNFTEELGA